MSGKRKLLLGVFIVGGILLFSFGLFIIGSREQAFSHHFHVYTDIAQMDTMQTGAPVRVSGMDAGQVTAIDIPKSPSQKFRVTLEIDEKFHPMVRENSVASIETAGMVGAKYVNITEGTGSSPECPPGGTLPSKPAADMSQLMKQGNQIATEVESTIKDVHAKANETLDSINKTVNHVDGVVVAARGNIEQIASNGAGITADVHQITSGITQGQGAAGKLLTDKTVASNVETTISQAKQTSTNAQEASQKVNAMISDIQRNDLPDVHNTLNNASDMSAKLDNAVGSFLAKGNHNEDTAVALRNTIQQSQDAVTNLSDDTEALKHNFFLRGFFHRRGFFSMSDLTPAKYDQTRFVKKPTIRVWVPAAGLFEAGSNGAQQLTGAGQTILNKSMSDIVPYLPNNPIVIEGYAVQGLPDERYVESRQRALEVREYLDARFHLKAEMVGIMPLRDQPPPGTGKTSWDGICLTLAVSKR